MRKKCLDTYALIEITKANPDFSIYLSQEIIITDITLAEFYAVLLHEDGKKTADYWFNKLSIYSVSVNKKTLKDAVAFRYQHKKKRISFFDAVGYIFSIRQGYLFVTGDKEFQQMKNVEFTK